MSDYLNSGNPIQIYISVENHQAEFRGGHYEVRISGRINQSGVYYPREISGLVKELSGRLDKLGIDKNQIKINSDCSIKEFDMFRILVE